jgi:hypothetical protein
MRKYIMTSKLWEGEITYVYSNKGYLMTSDFSAARFTIEQYLSCAKETVIYITDCDFDKWKRIMETKLNTTIIEVKETLTFADFWAAYFKNRHKDNSSKKKAEIRWNRMTEAQRQAACNHIRKYMANIPNGTVPKLAETYLNSEVWEG